MSESGGSGAKYDAAFWEELWAKTLSAHRDKVASRPPNAHLVRELSALPAGRALDVGAGHGAETLWLAARGFRVTALDVSASAVAQGREMADALGAEVSERIDWVVGDFGELAASEGKFDLVLCLYLHAPRGAQDLIRRLARHVAPGGTLFLVGHRPLDPVTGTPTIAAGQTQLSLEDAREALADSEFILELLEERPRGSVGSGVDAVLRARAR